MSIFNYVDELLLRLRDRDKVYADTLLNTIFQSLEEQKMTKGKREGVRDAINVVLQLNKDFFESKSLKPELREYGNNEVY
jgi:hypothetical protein